MYFKPTASSLPREFCSYNHKHCIMFLPERCKREGESCCSLSLTLVTNIGLKVISDLDRADWYLNLFSDFLFHLTKQLFDCKIVFVHR